MSTRGVVAAPHYLSTLAGIRVLEDGGNAMDAAIAANAVTMVVWPQMCGLGGDMFAIVYEAGSRQVHGLNGSGRAPAGLSWSKLREQGFEYVPNRGVHSVSVPGAVDGLFTLWERFGSLPMQRLLKPAIDYARDGVPLSPSLAPAIERARQVLEASGAARLFLPGGRPLRAGDLFVQADMARSFELIAANGKEVFYRGELGRAIVSTVQTQGGTLSLDDLAEHRSDWVEPIKTSFKGLEVMELPPNCQGMAVLELLNLVEPYDFGSFGHNSVDSIHHMVEAKKLAFDDRNRHLADPTFAQVPVDKLISRQYADERRRELDPQRAAPIEVDIGPPGSADTMYLCTADRDGNLVSLIQSLFNNFGSGVLVEGTGILLQNRGSGFSLDPDHPNRLEPRKRPRHTLTPAMALQEGEPLLVFGTRGADGQPQTQLQLITNVAVHGMDPQQAVEAPRWVSGGPGKVHAPDALVLEGRIAPEVADELRARGHNVFVGKDVDMLMGTAQMIRVDGRRGLFIGGADPRGESAALGY